MAWSPGFYRSGVALRNLLEGAIERFTAFRILLAGASVRERRAICGATQRDESAKGFQPDGLIRVASELEQGRSHASADRFAWRQATRRGDASPGADARLVIGEELA